MAESDFITWYLNTFNYNAPAPVGKGAGTPYYRYWELAVNVPIPNNRFSYPKRLVLTLSSTASTNTVVIVATGDDANLANILVNEIGTGFAKLSKADGSLSEVVEVVSCAVTDTHHVTITLKDNVVGTFIAGSFFEKYTTKSSLGWNILNSTIEPVSIFKRIPPDLDNIDGKITSQLYKVRDDSYSTGARRVVVSCPLSSNIRDYLFASYKYRIGARYSLDFDSESEYNTLAPTIGIETTVYTGSPRIISLGYFSSTAKTDFRSYNFNQAISQTLESQSNLLTQRYLYLAFTTTTGVGSDSKYTNLAMDELYWEHSAGVENQLGCILLPNAPDANSISIGKDEDFTLTKTSTGDKFGVFNYGNPNYNPKYNIGCHFDSVPLAILNKFKIIEKFQNDGFQINLHTHLNELPQCLTGKMTISNIKKSSPSFQRTSFDLYFEEM